MTALTLVSRQRMLTDPVGHAGGGEHHVMWCVDPGLTGVSLWGRLSETDIVEMLAPLSRPHHPALALPCDTVLDGQRLEGLEPRAFDVFAEQALRYGAVIAERTRRQAVVRPAGMAGALFAGFNDVLTLPYEWRVFPSLAQALVWLGRDDAEAIDRDVARMVASSAHASPLVASLQTWLRVQTEPVTISRAARALGVSTRSLQRHLSDHGLSFRGMVDAACLERVEELLVETDLKIEVIARQVGMASAGNLSKRFRRAHGVTPGEWRRVRGYGVRAQRRP